MDASGMVYKVLGEASENITNAAVRIPIRFESSAVTEDVFILCGEVSTESQ